MITNIVLLPADLLLGLLRGEVAQISTIRHRVGIAMVYATLLGWPVFLGLEIFSSTPAVQITAVISSQVAALVSMAGAVIYRSAEDGR